MIKLYTKRIELIVCIIRHYSEICISDLKGKPTNDRKEH